MHWNILLLRRKLSALLLISIILLLGLWTWVLLDTDDTYFEENAHTLSDFGLVDRKKNSHSNILQDLILQANRVLRYNRQQRSNQNKKILTDKQVELTTLSLVARRKKSAVVGESYLFEEERLKILEDLNSNSNNNNNIKMDEDMLQSSAERQIQYERDLQRMGVPFIAGIGPDSPQAPNERLVHLDLKGAPPKLSYLKQLLPMLKTLGATGLLIEYEDMFPFTGALKSLCAKNAYDAAELKDFLLAAVAMGLNIVPLVQTFGHLEYALKLQEFSHLRELPQSPQALCPSQNDAMNFIENILTQVIDFHLVVCNMGKTELNDENNQPNFSHIHIGCDEVYRMGECEKCRERGRHEIFLTHTTNIASFVRNRWPQLQVIIWDDMLREITLSEIQHSNIGNYVEPMLWLYGTDIYQFLPPQLWDKYAQVFPSIWAASAFKGSFGETLLIPPLQRHLENNIRWLAVIAKEGLRFSKGVNGLAITGWQRYDHFAALCELLPTSIPSLIVTLSTVSKGFFESNPKENKLLSVLDCASHPDIRRSGHLWIEINPNSHHHSQLFSTCTYPGSEIYKFVLRLFDKIAQAQNYLMHVQDRSAWLSDYNVRHNFTDPLKVQELMTNTPLLVNELIAMAKEVSTLMNEIYDVYTIAEFVEQQIFPTINSLERHLERTRSLLQTRNWVQRPFPIARELFHYNLISNEVLQQPRPT